MPSPERTVLITGAAGRLGHAVTATFASQGAHLVLLDRQQAALDAAFGTQADALRLAADLLDRAQTQAAVAAAIQRFGRIDVLCHIAGGFRMGEPVHETSDADWDFLFNINTRTLLNIARAAVPQMLAQGGGKIITEDESYDGPGDLGLHPVGAECRKLIPREYIHREEPAE